MNAETQTVAGDLEAAKGQESASAKALTIQAQADPSQPLEVYSNASNFALAQRMASALAASSLVPEAYRGNVPNCLIVLEMAARIRCSPLMVAQSLDIIHGRPSWRSVFIIASINSCGRFSPLRFKMEGKVASMERSCTATAIEKATGELLEGPSISMAMAKAEGWYDRNGSKWKTMPELMLRYRAAAFFGRLYAPEMLLGMHAAEEVADLIDVTPRRGEAETGVAGAKALLSEEEREALAERSAIQGE